MARPKVTRLADRALNPLIGKSLVVYATRPDATDTAGSGGTAGAVSSMDGLQLVGAPPGAEGAADVEEAHAGA
jgi:hypothetical protein